MKKFLILIAALLCATAVYAQGVNLADGYYRVHNYGTDRYIYVLDNTGQINMSSSSVDMDAITLYKGLDAAISDPASVLYLSKHDTRYDITAQHTGIYQMISSYLYLANSPKHSGCYYAYGKKSSVVMYLYDARTSSKNDSWLTTSGEEDQRNWYITPISASSDCYFGVKPTLNTNGKYYQPFYADFPFSFAGTGMKAYYITKLDEARGYVVYKEITGVVPASTPVIIECQSDQPVNNKLNIGGTASAVSGNLGVGVYFDSSLAGHVNQVNYTSNMRSLAVQSDGKLVMSKGTYSVVPRNQFYLPVSASAPASLQLVSEQEYEDIINSQPVSATGVTLSATTMSITIGESRTLTATIQPSNATEKDITWSSSNTAVATVDASGCVKAVGVGSAVITAKVGSVSATCQVTVTPVAATEVALNYTRLTLKAGETFTLSATVKPTNATDKTVTWSSSDTKVATVTADGTVNAIGEGTATITATCGSVSGTCDVTVTTIKATSVDLNYTRLSLKPGETFTLSATVKPTNATDKTVTWSSSDTKVATVTADGVVKAVGAGTASIIASCGNVSGTCEVTVTPVAATEVALNYTRLSLKAGETFTLSATVKPANTTDKTVTWSSSDTKVATVTADGVVKAVGAGTASITATCGSVSGTCEVTVTPVTATEVALNYTRLSLKPGETFTLSATVKPANAADKTVTWSSSNTAVATVVNGVVTAISDGTAVITASCGNVSGTCDVTVKSVSVTSVSLNYTRLELNLGDTFTLSATVKPDNATDKTVTWSSSNTAVATVSATGVVTAKSVGEAVITATSGNVSATCNVTVKPIEVTYISLNVTSQTLKPGETYLLAATVLPADATDKTVTWSTSDASVATVSATGIVTAVAAGEAVITATSGNVSATCIITVVPIEASAITLTGVYYDLSVGETVTINAYVYPEDAENKTVTWTSSDESVATVDANGIVTAEAPGTAQITASCGEVTASCTIVVNPIWAEAITLDKLEAEILLEETVSLTATVTPDNTTDKTVTWTSSDESVATVDADGVVTAVAEGEAVITATCGNATASCTVTVIDPANGIADVIVDLEGSYDIYTLQGVLVRSNATTLSGLPSGVYVVAGNKYYVR